MLLCLVNQTNKTMQLAGSNVLNLLGGKLYGTSRIMETNLCCNSIYFFHSGSCWMSFLGGLQMTVISTLLSLFGSWCLGEKIAEYTERRK